jgi:hypothetical protein
MSSSRRTAADVIRHQTEPPSSAPSSFRLPRVKVQQNTNDSYQNNNMDHNNRVLPPHPTGQQQRATPFAAGVATPFASAAAVATPLETTIKPRKLANPCKESKAVQNLHRELLFNQKMYFSETCNKNISQKL